MRPGPFSCIETRPPPAPESVSAPAPRSCLICCGPTGHGFAHCFACRTLIRRLNLPLAPVLPVHLCPVPGPLYAVLLGYKEAPIAELRRQCARRVLALLSRFFGVHGPCVGAAIGGEVDVVMPVPSSSRPGRPSLEGVGGVPELIVGSFGPRASWLPAALQRADGPVGPMQPHARAFVVPRSSRTVISGARVLLLDDTYVSGSRAQSAAVALRVAGARSVLVVPIGRVLRPERVPAHAVFVAAQPTEDGHRARCVLAQTGTGRE